MFIAVQSLAQTDTTTYRNHQVLILVNGLKVEILKTRGKGLVEECDVIYYTTRRQEGKRMWQSVSRLQEEERAAQISEEIANPKKSETEAKISKPITPDKSVANVKTVAAGNIKPPGSAFQESIKRSDSLAKARAKLIDKEILAQIDNEGSEKEENSISEDSTYQKPIESKKEVDNIKIVPNEAKADDVPLTIDIVKPEFKTLTPVVHIQQPLDSDTASEENYIKNYGKPIAESIAVRDTALVVQKPAEVKEEIKAELSPEAITFPEAPKVPELRFEPLITTACLMISVSDSTIITKQEVKKTQIVMPKVVSNFVTAPLTIASVYKSVIDNSSIKINRQPAKEISTPGVLAQKFNFKPLSIPQVIIIKVDKSSIGIIQKSPLEKLQVASIMAKDYSTVPLTKAALLRVQVDKSSIKIIQSLPKATHAAAKNNDQANAAPSKAGLYEKVAEVKVNGVWRKAKVKEEKTVCLYKVQVEGSAEEEWIPNTQMRNLDSVATSEVKKPSQPKWNTNNVGCSFVPMPSFSMQSSFSNRIIRRMIYDKQVEVTAKGTKVGVSFLRLMNKEAFINEIKITEVETFIKYPAAPPGAMIFPVIAQYKVCEQIQGKIRSKTEQAQYSFFRNKEGVWSCIRDK